MTSTAGTTATELLAPRARLSLRLQEQQKVPQSHPQLQHCSNNSTTGNTGTTSSTISINGDKHCRTTATEYYWHHGHNCHSDYRSNRKSDYWSTESSTATAQSTVTSTAGTTATETTESYISINGDKYFRNNCHCNYWHHWHHRVTQTTGQPQSHPQLQLNQR